MACVSWVAVLVILWTGGMSLGADWDWNWDPVMELIVKPDSRWVEMVVKPVKHPIQELQVCVHLLTDITCKGKSFEMESPSGSKKFKIMGLACNLTYQFAIRPLLHGHDVWKYRDFFIPPCPTEPTTLGPTTSTSQSQVAVVAVVGALLAVVVVGVVVVVVFRQRIAGCKKGRRPSLPFRNSPQAAIPISQTRLL